VREFTSHLEHEGHHRYTCYVKARYCSSLHVCLETLIYVLLSVVIHLCVWKYVNEKSKLKLSVIISYVGHAPLFTVSRRNLV
jgi:hypothetical protein